MGSFAPSNHPSNYTATSWQPPFKVAGFAWVNSSHMNNPAETVHLSQSYADESHEWHSSQHTWIPLNERVQEVSLNMP